MSTSGLPLVVVGHGTSSPVGAERFHAFVDRVRRRAPELPLVEGGFIELSAPPVATAVAKVVAAGYREFVAVPLVLTAAGHGKGDIPAALARERLRHPGLRYRYGRPLGPHPVLQEIVADRIDAALRPAGQGKRRDPRTGTYVVLVGRGSTDPDANAEVAKVARLLWEGRGFAGVEPAFVSLTEPSVPAALEKVRRLGARRVVVAPYLLFPGVLPDRIVAQARAYDAAHPAMEVRTAGLIDDGDRLADLVVERYHEAIKGDIRMNCDTCAYRVTIPGFADKVGRPQTPHHHPDDAAHPHVHGTRPDDHPGAHAGDRRGADHHGDRDADHHGPHAVDHHAGHDAEHHGPHGPHVADRGARRDHRGAHPGVPHDVPPGVGP